jgi:hypothetical protein
MLGCARRQVNEHKALEHKVLAGLELKQQSFCPLVAQVAQLKD